MTTEEIKEYIEKYVDDTYFDREKLLKYLEMHRMVGNEIFKYIYKPENWKYNRQAYSNWLDDETGYYPLYKDSFIQRIPFYFYVADRELSSGSLNYGSLDGVLRDRMKGDYRNADELEDTYQDLIYLFYDKKLALQDIFNYYVDQTGYYEQGMFGIWVKYVRLCDELGYDDFCPDRLITAYNRLLVKKGEQPIIYKVRYDIRDGIYQRNKMKLYFNGCFPCDEYGNPIMEWIGVRVENAGNITCDCEKSAEGNLCIDILPDTKIYVLEEEENGEYWYVTYCGPKAMRFDYESLQYYRKQMGLTQQQVADAIDTNVRTYQKWEQGATTPDCQNLIRLMNWLNITDVQNVIKYEK